MGTFEAASQCYGKSDFEGAAKHFIICLHCAEKDDNTVLQARAAANLASVFEMIGEEDMAIKVWVYGGYELARRGRGGRGVQRVLSTVSVCVIFVLCDEGGWVYTREGPFFVSVPVSV